MRNSLISNVKAFNKLISEEQLNKLSNEQLLRLCNPSDREFYHKQLKVKIPFDSYKQKYDTYQSIARKNENKV